MIKYRLPDGFGAKLFLASFLFLEGCGSGLLPVPLPDANAITGNWQISSTASAASGLPALSGQLTGSKASVTGIFHAKSAGACVSPTTPIKLSGSADVKRLVTLTGNIAGGTLTITGTLAADGRTLTDASYIVSGGSCAFSAPAAATAQSYSPITGTYVGSFIDVNNNVTDINVSLTQSSASDANGNFQLTGISTLQNNMCFPTPINISNAEVTGGSFTLTYTDPNLGNSLTANGGFSTDAVTLTVTNWVLSGPCGSAAGTGSLTRQ